MRIGAVLAWGGLLLAVTGSFVLLALAQEGSPSDHSTLPPLPRYTVQGVVLSRWNVRGLLRYRLHAIRLVRWPVQERLTDVRFRYHPGRPTTTLILAHHALRRGTSQRFLLWGDVRIRYARTPAGPTVHLRTTRLWVDPRTGVATTHALVTVTEGQSIVHGVGLRARLDSHRVRLLSHVRAILYPR